MTDGTEDTADSAKPPLNLDEESDNENWLRIIGQWREKQQQQRQPAKEKKEQQSDG